MDINEPEKEFVTVASGSRNRVGGMARLMFQCWTFKENSSHFRF